MSDLLWQKPGVTVDAAIQSFLAGDDVILDREFFLHDISASRAHAEGLQHIGILSHEELAALLLELDRLADDFRNGAGIGCNATVAEGQAHATADVVPRNRRGRADAG
jgi:argininosuccinate lyase